MLKEKRIFEKKIIDFFVQKLEEKRKDFVKRFITHSPPKLFILKDSNDKYTSEVRTYFYQNNKLVDVLEFFIFFDGHPEATISEFEIWFKKELDNIIQKAKK